MELKDNLKRIREQRGLSQPQLAEKASVSQQLISQIERGVGQTTKRLPEIARALDVSVYELDENYGGGESMISAPLLSWVSAGQIEVPEVPDFDPANPPPRRSAVGLNAGKWIALKVVGDSMDRISPPDSIIFVDLNDRRLVANACYVIRDEEEGGSSYKRYRPGRWEAVSTNKKHKPYILKGDRGPAVIGRVKRTVLDL